MKKLKNKILDNLYELREKEVEKDYYRESKDSKKIEKETKNIENELKKIINESISDKNLRAKIEQKIQKLKENITKEKCIYNETFYKIGFTDGMNLKKEININLANIDVNTEVFFSGGNIELLEYIDSERVGKIRKREDYKKITMEIKEIKKKYPKVKKYIEDEELSDLSKEELQAVLEIIDLQEVLTTIEGEEVFKLGLKNGILL